MVCTGLKNWSVLLLADVLSLWKKVGQFELRLPYLGHMYVGPRNRTHCPNADTKNVHCMCNTNFLKEGTQGNTNLQTLTLLTLCCIWTDQMQIVFEFRSYIDYTETYIQMFLSFHFTTNQPTVQATDYDKSTWVVLIPLKQLTYGHTSDTYQWENTSADKRRIRSLTYGNCQLFLSCSAFENISASWISMPHLPLFI